MTGEHRPFEVGDEIVYGNTVAILTYFDLDKDVARYKTADNNTHNVHATILQKYARHLTPDLHTESVESIEAATQEPVAVQDRLAKARAAKAAKAAAKESATD